MTSKWCICSNCDGNGSHAKALGIINTQEWDSDDLDKYMQGAYDSRCEVCDGAGKVLTTSTKEPNHYYETDEEYFRKREGGY